MSVQSYRYTLFADYFQFYLMDPDNTDDTSDIWTPKALDLKLGCLPNTLAIGTFRNVNVPVEVQVHSDAPQFITEEWDHIALGYFTINSGVCSVLGCTDYLPDAETLALAPGTYAALSLAKGLDSISEEWEAADDMYVVMLWPSNACEYKDIKVYKEIP